jgi:hypothetical protein
MLTPRSVLIEFAESAAYLQYREIRPDEQIDTEPIPNTTQAFGRWDSHCEIRGIELRSLDTTTIAAVAAFAQENGLDFPIRLRDFILVVHDEQAAYRRHLNSHAPPEDPQDIMF